MNIIKYTLLATMIVASSSMQARWDFLTKQQDAPIHKAQIAAHKADPLHFANIEKNLQQRLGQLMYLAFKSNRIYRNCKPGDIAVLDISQPDIPKYVHTDMQGYPMGLLLGIVPLEGRAIETQYNTNDFLAQKFPKAKHVLLFNPFWFDTLDSLLKATETHMAYVVSTYVNTSWWPISYSDPDHQSVNTYSRRVQAALKTMCVQQKNGTWVLKKNYSDIIHTIHTIDQTVDATESSNKEHLDIMNEFVTLMHTRFNHWMTQVEFETVFSLLAIQGCMKHDWYIPEWLLNTAHFTDIHTLPRLKGFALPDIKQYNIESQERQFSEVLKRFKEGYEKTKQFESAQLLKS